MDVLSALIAYEQKLTMCLSSSFSCRLLSSKTLLFWVSVQIPLSGALPIRGDVPRDSYNGNWVGTWTNSDSYEGGALSAAHSCTPVHSQLAEMEGFQLILLSFAVLTVEPVRRQLRWGHVAQEGFVPVPVRRCWDPARSLASHLCRALMSYCIPEPGVQSDRSYIHLLCQRIPVYPSYIYPFWKKAFVFVISY